MILPFLCLWIEMPCDFHYRRVEAAWCSLTCGRPGAPLVLFAGETGPVGVGGGVARGRFSATGDQHGLRLQRALGNLGKAKHFPTLVSFISSELDMEPLVSVIDPVWNETLPTS